MPKINEIIPSGEAQGAAAPPLRAASREEGKSKAGKGKAAPTPAKKLNWREVAEKRELYKIHCFVAQGCCPGCGTHPCPLPWEKVIK